MALLVFAFSFYIIFCHYACDLTSRMTVTPDKLDIRSFEDVERLGYTVIAKHGTSTAEKLKDIQNLTGNLNIKIIDFSNEKLRNDSWFVSDVVLDQAKTLILGVSSTYAASSDGLYALALDQPTEILLSFGLQKDSEYTKIFSHHLRRMAESGLLHRLERKWKPKLITNTGDGNSVSPLGYENVLFPFMGVVFGIMIAVSALLCEMMAAWKHKGKLAIQEGKVGPPTAAKYFPP